MQIQYMIEFFGDLGGSSYIYKTFSDAIMDLAREWNWIDQKEIFDKWGNHLGWAPRFIPDPEDDRVVIWELTTGSPARAVWHFSGWHWDQNAQDLHGGPLDQGCLPVVGTYWEGKSLYEIAMDNL